MTGSKGQSLISNLRDLTPRLIEAVEKEYAASGEAIGEESMKSGWAELVKLLEAGRTKAGLDR